jgi:hypothetical protein
VRGLVRKSGVGARSRMPGRSNRGAR